METNFEFKSVTATNDPENPINKIISMNFSDGKNQKTITLAGSGNIKETIKL